MANKGGGVSTLQIALCIIVAAIAWAILTDNSDIPTIQSNSISNFIEQIIGG